MGWNIGNGVRDFDFLFEDVGDEPLVVLAVCVYLHGLVCVAPDYLAAASENDLLLFS